MLLTITVNNIWNTTSPDSYNWHLTSHSFQHHKAQSFTLRGHCKDVSTCIWSWELIPLHIRNASVSIFFVSMLPRVHILGLITHVKHPEEDCLRPLEMLFELTFCWSIAYKCETKLWNSLQDSLQTARNIQDEADAPISLVKKTRPWNTPHTE